MHLWFSLANTVPSVLLWSNEFPHAPSCQCCIGVAREVGLKCEFSCLLLDLVDIVNKLVLVKESPLKLLRYCVLISYSHPHAIKCTWYLDVFVTSLPFLYVIKISKQWINHKSKELYPSIVLISKNFSYVNANIYLLQVNCVNFMRYAPNNEMNSLSIAYVVNIYSLKLIFYFTSNL